VPDFPAHLPLGDETQDRLAHRGIVLVSGELDDLLAHRVVAQLLDLAAARPDQDVTLVVNSPGGSLTAMSAVHDTMNNIDPDIRTRGQGHVGTTATVLLAAGTPGKRQIARTATAVVRHPRHPGARGDATDLRIAAAEAVRGRTVLAELLARHTGRSAEQTHADLDRGLVLSGPEAVLYGLADEVR
jgi:ATP-dependent Clp protease protease subunit